MKQKITVLILFLSLTLIITNCEKDRNNPFDPKADGYIPPIGAPAAPIGAVASYSGATGKITISWTAVSGASAYKLYRSMPQIDGMTGEVTAEGTYTEIATGITTTIKVDAALTEGSYYCYRVSAYNTAGESAKSDYALQGVGLPAPENPEFTVPTATEIDLTWDAVTGASGYKVERSDWTMPPGFSEVYDGVNVFYNDPGLTAGNAYLYTVCAKDAYFTSVYSADYSVACIQKPATFVHDNSTFGDLLWTDTVNEDGYKIYRSVGTANPEELTVVTNDSTAYDDSANVTSGLVYHYTVVPYADAFFGMVKVDGEGSSTEGGTAP